MTRTHLLIDGDIVAFACAAAAQGTLMDEAGCIQPIAFAHDGEALVENMLTTLMKGLGGDSSDIFLSDPKDNWRRLVDPGYKTNRTNLVKPLLLDHLKQYLRSNHGALHWPGLEADDVLGIMMTNPNNQKAVGWRFICVGRDKDFKSIPGLHHSWKQDVGPKGELLVREVSQWEGDRFHLMQTLAGDRVDGFTGCPGIGLDRAAGIIDAPMILTPKQGVKTRGVNKGEATTKWIGEPTTDLWACIVSNYAKQGLGMEDALRTARLARILRHGEYDAFTESVTLWTPDRLKEISR